MIHIEKEYKYLVDKIPDNFDEKLEIEQSYFIPDKVFDVLSSIFSITDFSRFNTFRLRKIKKENNILYIITLKGKTIDGYWEAENQISSEIYSQLITQPIKSIIIKNRYIKKIEGYNFEFDEYLNLSENMITCEVEYEENPSFVKKLIEETFIRNDVKFKDVTNDIRYKNSHLYENFGKVK